MNQHALHLAFTQSGLFFSKEKNAELPVFFKNDFDLIYTYNNFSQIRPEGLLASRIKNIMRSANGRLLC